MRVSFLSAAVLLSVLPACGGRADRPQSAAATANWREIATPADRGRVRAWRTAWTQALARAKSPADRAAVAGEGVLLRPDAGLVEPAPPPGDYRCRTIKLGSQQAGGLDYIAYPTFRCRIAREGDLLDFAKLSGSQRPAGLLFPDDGGRLVLLGSMTLGDERRPLDYGRDAERDVVGLLERIGPRRWRLALPFPRWESTMDVIELTPAQ